MVAQATLLLFGSFFVMLLAGVPISAGIGIASIFTALFSMDPAIFALTAAQRCFSGIDSFSLLALPFFSLGGNIMNKGGIAKRLVRLARLAVGKMPGYLAATNVLANMFFGAVSGSSVAATSAMGSIMAPLELDEGYDPNSPESAIMFEFIHDKNMAKSVELAKHVQKSVCSTANRPDKGVKQDVFLVLRETSMPAWTSPHKTSC